MFASRFLTIAFVLLIPVLASAQTAVNYCEPSPAVKADLKESYDLYEADLPFNVKRERQLASLQEALKKHPDDLHVRRRYLDIKSSGYFVDRDAVAAEYRALMEKNPNDPIAVYLYARVLVGRQTKEAIQLATKLTEDQPQFPWPYLQLAEIYNYPSFRDPAKMKANLTQWFAKCPAGMAGYNLISRSGDKEMMTGAAQRLRARLESSTKDDDLGYWDQLWTIEFKIKPVPEHAQLRAQIAEDLKRIRGRNLNNEQWLEALQAGYKQVGDKANQRWVEDELVRLLPKSSVARRTLQSRYNEEHPYPKSESSEAEKQDYDRAFVQATGEWLKTWPNDDYTWSNRVRSLVRLNGVSNSEVETAYNAYAKTSEISGGFYSLPPLEVQVARFYLKQNYHLADVPRLIQRGLDQIERIDKNNPPTDLYPNPDGVGDDTNLKYVQQESWPLLAEAYARLKQPEKARAVLGQMAELVKKPKNTYGQRLYWEAVGKVAEVEHRKLDALTAYQTVIALRQSLPAAGKKDELSDNTQRLWKELGGTDQGWKAYLARTEVTKSKIGSAESSSWDSKDTALAEFELTDLQGRKWSHADLKGKVAFINFWATWCGPCRAELPYVQKLREQLKDRKDVVVITLNTDDEIGRVEPFMKENKYTFPVLLAQAYAESQGVNSIPRNWIISFNGKVMYEGIGFGNEGEEWLKKAMQMIEKVKGSN